MDDNLSETERALIDMAGLLYTRIVTEVITDGPNRDSDAAEIRAHIHGIQNWLKAQAVWRMNPERNRPLGGEVRKPLR